MFASASFLWCPLFLRICICAAPFSYAKTQCAAGLVIAATYRHPKCLFIISRASRWCPPPRTSSTLCSQKRSARRPPSCIMVSRVLLYAVYDVILKPHAFQIESKHMCASLSNPPARSVSYFLKFIIYFTIQQVGPFSVSVSSTCARSSSHRATGTIVLPTF